jgi:hypothetical protein
MSAAAIHQWLTDKGENVTLLLIQKYWKEVDDFYRKEPQEEPHRPTTPLQKKKELNHSEIRECILELNDLIREYGHQQGKIVFRARHTHLLEKCAINKVIKTFKCLDGQTKKKKRRKRRNRRNNI